MASLPTIKVVFDRRKTASLTKKASVEIEVYYNRQRTRISTGVSVLKQQWKNGVVVSHPEAKALNETIRNIYDAISSRVDLMVKNDKFDMETLKKTKETEVEKSADFLDWPEDRVLDNWVVPLATFRTLESVLRLPFSYTDMFDITVAGIRYQNDGCKKNTEMAEFWEVIDSLHSQGRIIEKAHFRIKYLTEFRAIGRSEAIRFAKAKPVLFLNAPAVSSLYTGRIAGGVVNGKVGNWATVMTYLKVQPSFLGLKQDRFNLLLPNGSFDYTVENENGSTVRKLKVNRPKALCFDYEMLKEKYSLNLETSSVRETDFDADEQQETSISEASPVSQQEELPF